MAVVAVLRVEAVNQVGGAKHPKSTDRMKNTVKQAQAARLDGQAWHPKVIEEVQEKKCHGRLAVVR